MLICTPQTHVRCDKPTTSSPFLYTLGLECCCSRQLENKLTISVSNEHAASGCPGIHDKRRSARLRHEEAGPDGMEKVGSSNTDLTPSVSKPVWPGRKELIGFCRG